MSRRAFFCTYFDRNYLARGLVLYQSLVDLGTDFTLWALCLDDASHEALTELALPGLTPVRLDDLLAADPELAAVRPTRSTIEFYFTLTPALPLYLLTVHPDIDIISYLDADLVFYTDPGVVLDEMDQGSVLIIPHGFPDFLREREVYGRFNVGMVCFRNDAAGRVCLDRWRAKCIEWCYDRVEDGKFADQKYLDDWPEVHDGVIVLDRPGVGLAPWNFMRFDIEPERHPPSIDGDALVFYHFHGFKSLRPWLYDEGLSGYAKMPRNARRFLYGDYLRRLGIATAELQRHGDGGATTGRRQPRLTPLRLVTLLRDRSLLIRIRGRTIV